MSSRGILMPVRLTDLVAAPPSRATNLKVALAALVLVVTAFSSVAMVHFAAPGGEAVLWREIVVAVSTRRLAGGPRLPLRRLRRRTRRRRALCAAEDRLLQLHHGCRR